MNCAIYVTYIFYLKKKPSYKRSSNCYNGIAFVLDPIYTLINIIDRMSQYSQQPQTMPCHTTPQVSTVTFYLRSVYIYTMTSLYLRPSLFVRTRKWGEIQQTPLFISKFLISKLIRPIHFPINSYKIPPLTDQMNIQNIDLEFRSLQIQNLDLCIDHISKSQFYSSFKVLLPKILQQIVDLNSN